MSLRTKIQPLLLTAFFLGLLALPAAATTYYVDLNCTNPTPPYTSWSTASFDIQSAVDAASPGDLILVTNGSTGNRIAVYQFNGQDVYGISNRVAITKPVTLESVNGPAVTYIQGVPNGSVNGAIRCVYMTNGAALIGFTLTNGAALNGSDPITGECGGGIWCESSNAVISNCVIMGCLAFNNGGGVYSGTLFNCTLRTNITDGTGGGGAANSVLINCLITNNMAARTGGGAYSCILSNCIIVHNLVQYEYANSGGGGVSQSILNNCMVSNNTCGGPGGGAYLSYLTNCLIINNNASNSPTGGGGICYGVAQNCMIISNSATSGGGAFGGNISGVANGTVVLNNCTITHNLAQNGGGVAGGGLNCAVNNCTLMFNAGSQYGGGAYFALLNDCVISSNSVPNSGPSLGGGAYQSGLYNCTVVANSAAFVGGTYNCHVYNSIVYNNSAFLNYSNYESGTFNFSCVAPNPGGIGNITNDPAFVNLAGGDYHFQSTSACINSGNNVYATNATDLDGNPRIQGGTVDVGAYEYQTPTSVISYAYLQQYGLPTDGSVDFADLDGTAFNVYQDWIAGLNPTNPASVLVMLPVTTTNTASGLKVTWQSVSGILYNLQRTTNLPTPFSTIQSNIVGTAGTTSYTDTSATNNIPYFYRVGVQAP